MSKPVPTASLVLQLAALAGRLKAAGDLSAWDLIWQAIDKLENGEQDL